MNKDELQELLADVAHVKLQDFHLGRVLEKLTTHLAHAHGLDPNEVAAPEETPVDDTEIVPTPTEGSGEEKTNAN